MSEQYLVIKTDNDEEMIRLLAKFEQLKSIGVFNAQIEQSKSVQLIADKDNVLKILINTLNEAIEGDTNTPWVPVEVLKPVIESLKELAEWRAKPMSGLDDSFTRPEVQRFAIFMEEILRENDHKGGWHKDTLPALLKRLYEEADELAEAIADNSTKQEITKEALDVANFAMMIADQVGGLYLNHKPGEKKI